MCESGGRSIVSSFPKRERLRNSFPDAFENPDFNYTYTPFQLLTSRN